MTQELNTNFRDAKYVSSIGNVSLEFVVDEKNKSVLFEYMTYDKEQIKIFLITLKKAMTDFINNKYLTIQQRVTYHDWTKYLKSDKRWKLINQDKTTNTCVISCDINNAIDCIANGLGISKNSTSYKTVL